MEGPPLGPCGEDITWPDQVAPRGRKASSTRKIKPQTSNRMACTGTQLEARAEDMRDPVTKRVAIGLIRYNPRITEMEVRKQPDWRPRGLDGEPDVEEREGEEQRERLMACRRKRIRQI